MNRRRNKFRIVRIASAFSLGVIIVTANHAAANMLQNVTRLTPPLTLHALTTGQVHRFYLAPQTWSALGQVGPTIFWIDQPSLVYITLMTAGITWLGRRRTRLSFSALGMIGLLSAAVMYIAGAIALRNNADPSGAGPWLAKMIMSQFYAGVVCVAYAAIDWYGPDKLVSRARLVCRTPAQRRHDRMANGQCAHCGYDLRGNPAAPCPECGWTAGHVPAT